MHSSSHSRPGVPTPIPGFRSLVLTLAICFASILAVGSVTDAWATPITGAPSVEAFDAVPDPVAAVANEVAGSKLDKVFTVEHRVPIGQGRHLYVSETFSLRSFLRFPRRAVLFLSGSAFRGNHWNIPVEGYDGPAMAARRGFFAYSVDYLGVGESHRPANGLDASLAANQQAVETLIDYIRYRRWVGKVDLAGAGYGGALALLVSADPTKVRSVMMSAMIYDNLLAGPLADPDFVAFLESSPDGYVFLPGESSLVFADDTPPEVVDYIVATQGGFYPTANFLVATGELPFFDPGVARVPGLVLAGGLDPLVGADDMERLAADYGTDGAQLKVNAQAGHAPRVQAPEIAAWFWQSYFDFVDPSNGMAAVKPKAPLDFDGTGPPPCNPMPCNGDIPAGIEFMVGAGEGR